MSHRTRTPAHSSSVQPGLSPQAEADTQELLATYSTLLGQARSLIQRHPDSQVSCDLTAYLPVLRLFRDLLQNQID